MYRIRSGSGAEAVYNSLEEFNAAVRRGAVAPEDEIFHMRANRWLDVKSHPHYRLALSGAGHAEPHAVAARPAAPAPKPGPGSSGAAQVNSQAASVSALVSERPQQTVLRPQLMPQPAPVSAPSLPRKSKELAFIDLGPPASSSQRNATVIEALKAPTPAPTAPKTESKSAPELSEVEFLVMDGGLESPVRTSQGLRTIPEDLDLLFDAPTPKVKPATTPAVVAAPAPPKPQAAPQVPVSPVEQRAAEVTPRKAPEAEAPKASAPMVEAPRPAAPKAKAAKSEAPKPEAPKVEAPKAAAVPASPSVAASSGHVAAVAAPKPPSQAVVAPTRAWEEDLSIPGAALLEAPAMEDVVTNSTAAPAASGRSRGMLAGAGAALLLVAVGMLAWKPWSGRAAAPSADQPSTSSVSIQGSGAAPVPGSPSVPTGNEPGQSRTTASGVPAPKSSDASQKTDPIADPQDDQIIAAARPNFRADVDVPSGDLGLGAELRAEAAPTEVIPPTELTRRLETAEKLAQLELGTKLGGFHSLFPPSRLAKPEGLTAARNAWSNGADVLRQYRAKIARMEKAYEDSVLTSQRAKRWSSEEMRAWAGHQSQAEPVETSQLIDLMFSQVSEGLDLLAALDGQYQIKGGVIAFKNPTSGTRYMSIRTWVDQRMQAWSGTPESARAYSVSAVLRALGDGLPETQ